MDTVDTPQRTAGRRRDPRTDAAAVDAVLDLITGGATLSGLSLVTIAEHVGVSRNSLYRRWKTKDDLYLDVLDAINRPLPAFTAEDTRADLTRYLALLIERALDRRASAMLRALQAEATAFPELHARYFAEIVSPRREAVYAILRRGIAAGELHEGLDVELVGEVLVAPVLARLSSGTGSGTSSGADTGTDSGASPGTGGSSGGGTSSGSGASSGSGTDSGTSSGASADTGSGSSASSGTDADPGPAEGLDPAATSRRIVDLLYDGIRAR